MQVSQHTFLTVIVKRPVAAICEGGLLIVHVRFNVCRLTQIRHRSYPHPCMCSRHSCRMWMAAAGFVLDGVISDDKGFATTTLDFNCNVFQVACLQ